MIIMMFELLLISQTEIKSRATKSVPSPIKNLVDVNKHVNISQLLSAIGYVTISNSMACDKRLLTRGFFAGRLDGCC